MFHASFWRRLAIVVSGILLIGVMVPATAFAVSSSVMRSHAATSKATSRVVPECPTANPGYDRCFALRLVKTSASTPNLNSLPFGYHPADLQSAYKLPSMSRSKGQLVAIVDAFDDPNAESDLAVYRAQFGLPSCTSANGCFKKVNQTGGTTYPTPNTGWATEISLDLDMVSAICPNCHILLVEANDNSFTNLGTAVNEAVTLGANEVSNSYGGSESANEQTLCSAYYNHPAVAVTVSAGDSGYAAEEPAACNTVTAVGGTSLSLVDTTWYETVWKGTGSGCSAYIAKPAWQQDTGCSKRTNNDVSAVADPGTGLSIYDTYNNSSNSAWLIEGGTSASAPIIAAVYALAGNAATVNYGSYPYLDEHRTHLRDVTVGSNGTCSPAYLCTAETGYDGPTGLGTPQGTGAF
jgi:subtilase family serine protease